ncbi:MAG TPA: DUF2167 domain-containing protein [Labilithrix sp.]|nr:DUF2167 domain-containing protein [Labilithrix sp.]
MRFHYPFLFVVGILLFFSRPALASDPADPTSDPASSSGDADEGAPPDPVANLPWKSGPAPLDLGHGVTVALPAGYRFLGQPDAGRLMTKLGNLHNEDLLGVVLSEADENGDYFVTFRYEEGGFIKDDETVDGKEILESIREGEPEYNEERKKAGFPPIHAEGWQEEPRYDRSNHHLVWALTLSSERGRSVNLNTRVLGRKGYVSVNLVTEPELLARYRNNGTDLLRATTFVQGSRYEDFDSSKDKVAEYGLTGLVLGGAGVGIAKAAKIGLLAKFWKVILGILIAGKKAVIAAFVGLAALVRKLFSGKKTDDAPPASST